MNKRQRKKAVLLITKRGPRCLGPWPAGARRAIHAAWPKVEAEIHKYLDVAVLYGFRADEMVNGFWGKSVAELMEQKQSEVTTRCLLPKPDELCPPLCKTSYVRITGRKICKALKELQRG